MRMRRHLIEINEAIGSLKVELPAGIGERHGDLVILGETCVNLRYVGVYRVFNEDWLHGGRLYGHYTQSLPRAIRRQLAINGENVAEPDYSALHLRILYALAGLPLISDPYDLDGWERNIVKHALLILINAPTHQSAIGAVTHKYGISHADAARLIDEIKRKHKLIEARFHSDAGRWLQRLDSDMTERVLLGLTRQGVVALPVHDSFIVPAKWESEARQAMERAFEVTVSRERGVSPKPQRHQGINPITTYTMVDLSLATSPSLPAPPSSVPRSLPLAFFDAERRITISGRVAVRQAQRQRCLGQGSLASLVGVRRPTLANILAGRFGTSAQTAERIAEIVAMTPACERQPFLPGLAA